MTDISLQKFTIYNHPKVYMALSNMAIEPAL